MRRAPVGRMRPTAGRCMHRPGQAETCSSSPMLWRGAPASAPPGQSAHFTRSRPGLFGFGGEGHAVGAALLRRETAAAELLAEGDLAGRGLRVRELATDRADRHGLLLLDLVCRLGVLDGELAVG